MFQQLCSELLNDITAIFDGDRKRIKFTCTVPVPYEIISYLESVGVTVWPTHDIRQMEDGTVEGAVLVAPGQFDYAAGLIEGYPGYKVVSVPGVKAIQPRTSWGKPNRTAKGPLATLGRMIAVGAKTPPVKQAAKQAQPPTNKRQSGRKITKCTMV